MRVFIPTKGRAQVINSHLLFSGMDVTIVVHNAAERADYLRNPTIRPEQVLVSETLMDRAGLTRQREWIMNTLVRPGEWFVFADDNIQRILAVPQPYYEKSLLNALEYAPEARKRIFRQDAQPEHLRFAFEESIQAAQYIGAQMVGFAVTDHTLSRGRKYRTLGYVIGKMLLMQHNTIPFDHTITMEDFRNTAEHLLHNGSVLINNFVVPMAKHYQSGGMGTYGERIAYRQADVFHLLQLYPGLFRVKQREGFAPNTDLAMKITTPKGLQAWRKAMLSR